MEIRGTESTPSFFRDEELATQNNALQVPPITYTNASAVDSVMSVNDDEKSKSLSEKTDASVTTTVVELPKEWGTPFLRRLRCEFYPALYFTWLTAFRRMG